MENELHGNALHQSRQVERDVMCVTIDTSQRAMDSVGGRNPLAGTRSPGRGPADTAAAVPTREAALHSLRTRLVLGFALVALVPLALAMALLAARIQETVRTEAANRLNATLGIVAGQIRADAERIHGRLKVLARERGLASLGAAAQPGDTALVRELTTRRYLLGLDVLEWIGPGGLVVAAAEDAPPDSVFAGADAAGGTGDLVGAARLASPASGTSVEEEPGRGALLLIARAPVTVRGAAAGLLRGGVRMDGTWLARQRGAADIELALRGAGGATAASTLAATLQPFLPLIEDPEGAGLSQREHLGRRVPIERGGADRGAELIGIASTTGADRTVAALWTTSALLGLLGLAVALALGFLWSGQVARPLQQLAGFSARVARGEWDEPLAVKSFEELETLAQALERMRADLRAYRTRLLASERQAAWSQMARMVAHEVQNPLTPIAVSIADLKRSFEQQRPDFPHILAEAARTIGEEVEALKRLLHEFSEFGRMPEPVLAPVRLAEVLGDLRSLYHAEVAARRLWFVGHDGDVALTADRAQLRQALINLVKNGLEATADGGRVQVEFKTVPGAVVIAVADTGPGIDPTRRERLFVPDHTTKPHGSGLGLTIVERIVTAHGGTIAVASEPGHGTRFEIHLPHGGEEG
jgi:signal transduction histidine kinase